MTSILRPGTSCRMSWRVTLMTAPHALVSHEERDFLDRVVSSVVAVEGDGARSTNTPAGMTTICANAGPRRPRRARKTPAPKPAERPKTKATKLSFKEVAAEAFRRAGGGIWSSRAKLLAAAGGARSVNFERTTCSWSGARDHATLCDFEERLLLLHRIAGALRGSRCGLRVRVGHIAAARGRPCGGARFPIAKIGMDECFPDLNPRHGLDVCRALKSAALAARAIKSRTYV